MLSVWLVREIFLTVEKREGKRRGPYWLAASKRNLHFIIFNCACVSKEARGVRSTGAEVPAGCEPLDTGAGNYLGSSGRADSALYD